MQTSLNGTNKRKTANKNPGTFENYSRESRSVLDQKIFGGFVLEVNQLLNSQFKIRHSLQMGSQTDPASYMLGVSFIKRNNVLQGTINQKGDVRGSFLHKLSPKNLLATNFSFGDKDSIGSQFLHFGSQSTSSVEVSSEKNLKISQLRSFFQNRLVLGLKHTQFFKPKPHHYSTLLVGKLGTKKDTVTVEVSKNPNSFLASYVKKISNRIGFATDFGFNFANRQSTSSFGLNYAMRKTRFQTKLTSDGELSSTISFESLLSSCIFAAKINYPKNSYTVGFGVRMGADF
ncbi:import receptor subunit tom40 [Anaeramoeba flamelloides]|uniref:Import receptor subunit tom40 n=1 Tax=Anaeramoeba flamelloides TaxID=1746091 RepID=A0AAV7Z7R1_9EUKA|nr:import receptor subunit tom40 [Anaeramoeba flamelloides]